MTQGKNIRFPPEVFPSIMEHHGDDAAIKALENAHPLHREAGLQHIHDKWTGHGRDFYNPIEPGVKMKEYMLDHCDPDYHPGLVSDICQYHHFSEKNEADQSLMKRLIDNHHDEIGHNEARNLIYGANKENGEWLKKHFPDNPGHNDRKGKKIMGEGIDG